MLSTQSPQSTLYYATAAVDIHAHRHMVLTDLLFECLDLLTVNTLSHLHQPLGLLLSRTQSLCLHFTLLSMSARQLNHSVSAPMLHCFNDVNSRPASVVRP